MAASSPLVRGLPLLRRHLRLMNHHHHSLAAVFASPRRPICSASESEVVTEQLRPKNLSQLFTKIDDSEYRKWKDREDEILRDIQPTSLAAKEILHSDRYTDGERLTIDDEKFVVEKLLAYHPHSADKIGCGLDSIMVDRHPHFHQTRCLFVVRTDGGWIDFSYQKCLREYIRKKYPSYAERFIREHFKRSSG